MIDAGAEDRDPLGREAPALGRDPDERGRRAELARGFDAATTGTPSSVSPARVESRIATTSSRR
jgi:hypothetical protein